MQKPRQSNYELLRLAAIVLIVAMHTWGYAFTTTDTVTQGILLLVNAVGNTGVTLFVLLSGWFGIRFSTGKLLRLVFVVLTYSVLTYGLQTGLGTESLTAAGIRKALLPLLSGKYWFMTCYATLFCLSPWLNRAADNLPKRDFGLLLAVAAFFFLAVPTLQLADPTHDGGKGFVNMTLAYMAGRYLHRHGWPHLLDRHGMAIASGAVAAILLLNGGITAVTGHLCNTFARDNNLLVFTAALGIFRLIGRWHFSAESVNYLAGFAFPLYLTNSTVIALFSPWLTADIHHPAFSLRAAAVMAAACAAAFLRRFCADCCWVARKHGFSRRDATDTDPFFHTRSHCRRVRRQIRHSRYRPLTGQEIYPSAYTGSGNRNRS